MPTLLPHCKWSMKHQVLDSLLGNNAKAVLSGSLNRYALNRLIYSDAWLIKYGTLSKDGLVGVGVVLLEEGFHCGSEL